MLKSKHVPERESESDWLPLGDEIIEELEESQDSGYFSQEGGACDWDRAHGGTLGRLLFSFLIMENSM